MIGGATTSAPPTIRGDTLNIDDSLVENPINEKTKAVAPFHYGEVSCEMDAMMSVANLQELIVIKDAVHAVDAKYKDRCLGTIGETGTLSVHETKNTVIQFLNSGPNTKAI